MNVFDIYTDGACSHNPGPGGWGVVILHNDVVMDTLSGYQKDTTNNQMEMTAVIKALSFFDEKATINLFTDSNYVINGINSWIHNWIKKGWKTSSNSPVKNVELWKEINALNKFHAVKWIWVKGHSGNTGNDLADKLATDAIIKK